MFSACNKKVSQEDLIKAAVELKITQWRETFMTECRTKAYMDAEAYVDSVMVVYSLPTKMDTIPKPPKPSKPPKPFIRTKPDSVVVKEIEIKN
jgi:hypothetical protein